MVFKMLDKEKKEKICRSAKNLYQEDYESEKLISYQYVQLKLNRRLKNIDDPLQQQQKYPFYETL